MFVVEILQNILIHCVGENVRLLKLTADGKELTPEIQIDKETILLGMHKINKPVLVILNIIRHRQNPLEEFEFLLCFGIEQDRLRYTQNSRE
jgi:hypothetical protein